MSTFMNLQYDMKDTAQMLKYGGHVYVFSNENIPEYLENIGGVKDARVLSVGASGDHAFQSYYMGAAHVDTFDFNLLQRAVMDLKTIMIHNVSYEDFMEFFIARRNRYNPKIIQPLYSKLPFHVKRLMRLYQIFGDGIIRPDYNDFGTVGGHYYQTGAAYQTLREKLPPQINFTHTDIRSVAQKFTGKYNLIMLSNIYVYAYVGKDPIESLTKMYNEVLKPLADQHLAPGGTIFVNYSWGCDYMCYGLTYWQSVLEQVNKTVVKNGDTFDVFNVDSQRAGCYTDAVTIMKRQPAKVR